MELRKFESLFPERSRYEEIARLSDAIRKGSVCQIIGMEGVGRTVLLGLLAYNRGVRTLHFGEDEAKYHFVYTDFAFGKPEDLKGWVLSVFASLVRSIEEREVLGVSEQVRRLFEDATSSGDVIRLLHGFQSALDVLVLTKQMRVVFLLDSFEVYAPFADRVFFDTLRSLRDRYRYDLSVVVSSSRSVVSIVEGELASLASDLFSSHTFSLSLHDEVSFDFVTGYVAERLGKVLSRAQRDRVKSITGGHLKLVKVVVEEMDEKVESPVLVKNSSVAAVCEEIWGGLYPREQLFLKNLASGGEFDVTGASVQYLRDVSLLSDTGIFCIPLFRDFVLGKMDEVVSDEFVLDTRTGEIRKGDDVVSDHLTRSEYALLKYFISRDGEVVLRDDVISVVFGDVKASRGVSDEAVDQLIFRLRKKIEDDPEKPYHIQTVKGRGFVFRAKHYR
jgi:DNA-binding winged helix-turn-helix (wHTH) protein